MSAQRGPRTRDERLEALLSSTSERATEAAGRHQEVTGTDSLADPTVGALAATYRDVAEVRTMLERLCHAWQMEGRLEGVTLAARELAHRINNDVTVAVALLELLRVHPHTPDELRELADDATVSLQRAVQTVQRFQQVVRVEVKDTPVGPALDLERSAPGAGDAAPR